MKIMKMKKKKLNQKLNKIKFKPKNKNYILHKVPFTNRKMMKKLLLTCKIM